MFTPVKEERGEETEAVGLRLNTRLRSLRIITEFRISEQVPRCQQRAPGGGLFRGLGMHQVGIYKLYTRHRFRYEMASVPHSELLHIAMVKHLQIGPVE